MRQSALWFDYIFNCSTDFLPTSAILIKAASVAHTPRVPDFEVTPPGALSQEARIAWAVYSNPDFRDAYAREGVFVDWNAVARAAGVRSTHGVDAFTRQALSYAREANRKRGRRLPRSKL